MSITFFPTAGESEGVNLANGNAAAVFELLGITAVVDGEMDAGAFRDRVFLALHEPVLQTSVTPPPAPADAPAPRFIDCAAIPGVDNAYLTRRLEQLYEVAEEAQQLGAAVAWS